MEEYKKQMKDMIDFPEYVLGFMSVMIKKLRFYGMIDGRTPQVGTSAPVSCVLPIVSMKYAYCYDGIALIQKTMNTRGFDCTLQSYKVEELEDGKKQYLYTFALTMKNKD